MAQVADDRGVMSVEGTSLLLLPEACLVRSVLRLCCICVLMERQFRGLRCTPAVAEAYLVRTAECTLSIAVATTLYELKACIYIPG
jgi:hypothetical protein